MGRLGENIERFVRTVNHVGISSDGNVDVRPTADSGGVSYFTPLRGFTYGSYTMVANPGGTAVLSPSQTRVRLEVAQGDSATIENNTAVEGVEKYPFSLWDTRSEEYFKGVVLSFEVLNTNVDFDIQLKLETATGDIVYNIVDETIIQGMNYIAIPVSYFTATNFNVEDNITTVGVTITATTGAVDVSLHKITGFKSYPSVLFNFASKSTSSLTFSRQLEEKGYVGCHRVNEVWNPDPGLMTLADIQDLRNNGHEMISYLLDASVSEDQQESEITTSVQFIVDNHLGEKVQSPSGEDIVGVTSVVTTHLPVVERLGYFMASYWHYGVEVEGFLDPQNIKYNIKLNNSMDVPATKARIMDLFNAGCVVVVNVPFAGAGGSAVSMPLFTEILEYIYSLGFRSTTYKTELLKTPSLYDLKARHALSQKATMGEIYYKDLRDVIYTPNPGLLVADYDGYIINPSNSLKKVSSTQVGELSIKTTRIVSVDTGSTGRVNFEASKSSSDGTSIIASSATDSLTYGASGNYDYQLAFNVKTNRPQAGADVKISIRDGGGAILYETAVHPITGTATTIQETFTLAGLATEEVFVHYEVVYISVSADLEVLPSTLKCSLTSGDQLMISSVVVEPPLQFTADAAIHSLEEYLVTELFTYSGGSYIISVNNTQVTFDDKALLNFHSLNSDFICDNGGVYKIQVALSLTNTANNATMIMGYQEVDTLGVVTYRRGARVQMEAGADRFALLPLVVDAKLGYKYSLWVDDVGAGTIQVNKVSAYFTKALIRS